MVKLSRIGGQDGQGTPQGVKPAVAQSLSALPQGLQLQAPPAFHTSCCLTSDEGQGGQATPAWRFTEDQAPE